MADKFQNTITVRFKPVGDEALITAITRLDRVTKNLVKTQTGMVTSSNKGSRGLFDLNHSARQTSGAFSVLRSKLLLFNFAMGLGIRQITKFTKEAAQLEDLETAFTTMSNGVEDASVALDRLREATNGTVSDFDLFKQANNAMILGVSKSSEEMAQMFDMAQRLGKALGRDTRSSIESFVTGVGRQSRLMLDNIGLIVKAEVAYQALATELKKNADDLTEAEKKQAFLNAAIVAGRIALRDLGAETLSSSDKFAQLDVSMTELRQEIGMELLPIMLDTVSALKDFADTIDSANIRNGISAIETFIVSFATYKVGQIVGSAALSLMSFARALGLISTVGVVAISTVSALAAILTGGLAIGLYKVIDAHNEENALLNEKQGLLKDLEKLYTDQIKNLKMAPVTLEEFKKQVQAETDIRIKSIKDAKELIINRTKFYSQEYGKTREIINAETENEKRNAEIWAEITQGLTKEQIKNNKEALEDLQENVLIRRIVYETDAKNHERELKKKKLQEDAYHAGVSDAIRKAGEELAALQSQKQADNDALVSNAQSTLLAFNSVLSAWDANIQARIDSELSALRDTAAYQRADAERRKDMERSITNSYADEQKKKFRIGQAMALAEIGMNTASALMKSVSGSWVTIGQPWFGIISALGALQAMAVLAQKPPSFEHGGIVGGRRHSQGGTIIEAERGEFVMSRNAVQSIGVETLNQMNRGGGAGVTINIQGNMVGNESFVRDTLIPEISKATQQGLA